MKNLTPKDTVAELDKFIIGQDDAKRAVAIALRNRWRRKLLDESMKEEVLPKNIILIGPTGVGKTEIARRLAKLANAPFLKVEATKYTEVGYVGKDVESMIRDLTEIAVNMVKEEERKKIKDKVELIVEEKLLDLLVPSKPKTSTPRGISKELEGILKEENTTREKFRKMLREGKLEEKEVKIDVRSRGRIPVMEIFSSSSMEEMDVQLRDIFGNFFPKRKRSRKVKIKDARKILFQDESQKMIDMDKVISTSLDRVQNYGIVFIDELDKIASREKVGGADVSREGVQRDILPIVEGSNVLTKYGMVKTDHILFIASGAFHVSKPSDLIPELQGRFPIRVELKSLTKDDFKRILLEPKNSLIKQYKALIKTEDVDLVFENSSIDRICEIASEINSRTENIGARRLHTVMEKILDDISFRASDMKKKKVVINARYVDEKLSDIIKDHDLSRYIL